MQKKKTLQLISKKKEQTENRIVYKKNKNANFFQTLVIDPCLGSNMNLTITERTFRFHLLLFSLSTLS